MKFAVIAAGEGSRLFREGAKAPKPLVKINNEHLIDRLIRVFADNGANEVVVIVNCLTDLVKDHIISHYDTILGDGDIKEKRKHTDSPCVRLVCKTTPSSMHSFYELSKYLEDDKFCMTTVDTVFMEQEFNSYINAFRESETDGLMAVTDYIDDEKPLFVGTDENMNITGFHDTNEGDKYISGGIYCLTPKVFKTLQRCIGEGQSRMRNFQRQLIVDGLSLKAYPFKKIIDVDHIDDIFKAERFLEEK